MAKEIGRIVISVLLLGLAVFLVNASLSATTREFATAASGLAGTIVGAEITYWLKP